MVDLTEFMSRTNIGLGLAFLVLILFLKFFTNFPDLIKQPKKGKKKK
jgi:preprotein translocase subunit SecG